MRLIDPLGRVGVGARRGIGRAGTACSGASDWVSALGTSEGEGGSVVSDVTWSEGEDVLPSEEEAWVGGSGRHSRLGLWQ